MKKLLLFATASLTFVLAPSALQASALQGSLALLALGIGLAIAASGSFAALAAAGGALGAFATAVLTPVSPAAGGAVLVGLAFAERTSRVRGTRERLLHIGAALLGGALAGTLTAAYASSSSTLAVRVVAAVVAAVLVALPLFIEADDPIAHRLETFADDLSEPARTSLREGAELRRIADPSLLDRTTARQVKRTWAALGRLAEARLRLEHSVLARHRAVLEQAKEGPAARAAAVVKRVDERIAEHVAVLARAHAAVDTARAAEASLDDAALRSVEIAGESLETMTHAIVDEV